MKLLTMLTLLISIIGCGQNEATTQSLSGHSTEATHQGSDEINVFLEDAENYAMGGLSELVNEGKPLGSVKFTAGALGVSMGLVAATGVPVTGMTDGSWGYFYGNNRIMKNAEGVAHKYLIHGGVPSDALRIAFADIRKENTSTLVDLNKNYRQTVGRQLRQQELNLLMARIVIAIASGTSK